MIDYHLNSYSKMKDSGLPWVEQVPEHWELLPNRALVRQRKHIVGDRHSNFHLLSLTKQGVIVRDLTTLKGKFSEDMGTSQEVRAGDLIFCMFDVPETPRTVGLSRHYGMITGAYTVLETIGRCSKEFFEAFYLAMDNQKLLSPLYSGLRNTIPLQTFLQTKTPVPPEPEQAAVIAFLDHMDRRIWRYIRAKQKLIKLLEEQKQVIINRAVTRGFSANVRLKPSGIDWLGDVPEHWEIRRAKAVCSAIIDCKNRTPDPVENGSYIVVRTTCIRNGKFNEAGGYRTDERNHRVWTTRGAPKAGDVFFTREAPAGEAAIVPDRTDLCMGQRMMYFRPHPDLLDPKFLLLNIYGPLTRRYIELATNGSTVGHLRLGQVYALPILWCPLDEQRQIVAYVENELERLERARILHYSQMTLIGEYRTRLIADVVTGKLDVRDIAAQLPDEPEEPKTLEESDVELSLDSESTDALIKMLEPIEA